jgi:hypothetical protein
VHYSWDTAVERECPWCLALPGEGCRVLQGNSEARVETYADGRPAAAHKLRALVWDEEDMAVPCDYCGAGVKEPCRTVPGGYHPPSATYAPHVIRRARSRLAESVSSEVVHVRDPEHPGRSLCRVSVKAWVAIGVAEPTCRRCRVAERHLAMLARRRANTGQAVARSGT